MSVDYHDPIQTSDPVNASIVNSPLGQLDNAIGSIFSGSNDFSGLSFEVSSTLTISAGSITTTGLFHYVSAETGTSDTLTTITASNGSIVFLKATATHTINIAAVGNITGSNGSNGFDLTGNRIVMLLCEANQWYIIGSVGASELQMSRSVTPDWDGSFSDVQSALAELASRIRDEEEKPIASKSHIIGLEVNVSSNTIISISEGEALDGSHSELMVSANGGGVVDMTTTGINALDTGTVASSTKYAVWMVKGGSGTGFIASTNFTTPTQPTGYTDFKRYIGAVVTDGSSNLRRQKTYPGQGNRRKVEYAARTNASPFLMTAAGGDDVGTAGSPTTYDFSGLVPTTSREIFGQVRINTAASTVDIFWQVNSQARFFHQATTVNGWFNFEAEVDSSQQAQVYGDATDEDFGMWIFGYFDNLTPDLVSA